MNEQEVNQLLVKALNEQDRAEHQAILDDPKRLAQYRNYSWWSEEFVPSEPQYEDDVNWSDLHYGFRKVVVDDYTVEVVESFGGEGQGDHVHTVVKITDPTGGVEYWKKDGYYASHYGTDWDGDFRQVNAVERTVVFYE